MPGEDRAGTPRARSSAPAGLRPSSIRWMALVLATGAIAVIAITGWGLLGRDPVHSETFMAVPGGELRVDHIDPDVMSHVTMPGMSMPDPVPDGYRRFSLEATLVGQDDRGVSYDPSSFTLSGPGIPPIPPHRANAGPGLVPGGMQASVSLVFQVPNGAVDLRLGFRGAAGAIELGAVEDAESQADHDDDH